MLASIFLLSLLEVAIAADSDYKIIGSFIFGRHNDRSAKPATILTNVGAQGQYNAGQFYRQRYFGIDSSDNEVSGNTSISTLNSLGVFNNGDIYCEATSGNVILFSHYAFLQGLYPPVDLASSSKYSKAGNASLAWLSNGTLVEAPFGGYQYVNSFIQENATDDYIWTKGDENCPALTNAVNLVYSSNEEYSQLMNDTKEFYSGLYSIPFISANFKQQDLNFSLAYTLYDYVNVNTIHNATVNAMFNDSLIATIKYYSDRLSWLVNHYEAGPNLTIGASTLVGRILNKLNVTKTQGKPALNYLTGSYNTMFQLASILNLDDANESFRTMPNYGATYVFELLNNTSNDTFVRFSFKNGSDDLAPLIAYPLFNSNDTVMSWTRFVSSINKVVIKSVDSWCSFCGYDQSSNVIDMCVPYTLTYESAAKLQASGVNLNELASGNYESLKLKSSKLTLAQAGGIGAGTTIGVFLILGLVGFAFAKLFKRPSKQPILPTNTSVDDKQSGTTSGI